MKKIIFLVFVVLLLVGCTKQPSDIELLNELMNSIDIPVETKENLELPKTYTIENKEIEAIWTSSDENIISSDGVVFRSDVDSYVTIDLVLKLNSISLSLLFNLPSTKASDSLANSISFVQ